MKKPILIMLFLILSLLLTGCNYIEEQKAQGIVKNYYQALINEDYEKAFEQLHLYNYDTKTDDSKLSEGTTLSDEEAKEFYLKKIEVLKEQNYKLKDFEIGEAEYEDGHSFWHHITIQVEQNGQEFERTEIAEIYDGKLLIGGRDDTYVKYRDGKMNFDIEKEVKEDDI